MRIARILVGSALLLAAMAVSPLYAQVVQTEHTEAELVSEHQQAQPGGTVWVALRLRPDVGWHTYWQNPGDSGVATRLIWALPAGVQAGEIQWPYPELQRVGPVANYGYSGETLHLVPVTLPADWPAGKELTLETRAKWLVCADICIPGEASLSLVLPVRAAQPVATSWEKDFDATRTRLPIATDWPASVSVDENTVSLAIRTPQLHGAQHVEWFPVPNDLVAHAAPQRITLDADGLSLRQQRSDHFSALPQGVDGIVVATHRGETRAYRVSATTVAGTTGSTAGPGFAAALLFAFLGGLILNLMPCVFPVLSIKAISLMEARDESAGGKRAHALSYTAGVVVTFALLAGVLMLLQRGGAAIGWGFQLQQPVFVATLAYLFFAMGLSLSGVVTFGTQLMGMGDSLAHTRNLRGSFMTGVLAVVVASPCTAPFMGVAMGYALSQPAFVALAVFAVLGLGLATPFLLLGFVPALARMLPRPGAWMETFKQVMAFPLYLTVVWLIWVLGGLTDRHGMALALVGLTLVAFALWLWNYRGWFAALLNVVALTGAIALLAHPAMKPAAASPSVTEGWSAARVAELRAEGRTVFVNFTADWCVTCLVNERTALRSEAVSEAFAVHEVVYLKGDWTRSDPAITAELARFGRSGVPLYLLYRQGGEPEILPQLLTPDIVVSRLNP